MCRRSRRTRACPTSPWLKTVACAQDIQSFCEREGIREVPVCGMEELPLVLRGTDGLRYAEVDGNVWMAIGGRDDVAYVGTSRHGGHMTLRPLFMKREGAWFNAVTGRESDFTAWNKADV